MKVGTGAELFQRADALLASHPHRFVEYIGLLERASELGNPEAQENLAAWLLEGMTSPAGRRILPRSPRRAVALLNAAATAGNCVAQFSLGYCYDVGLGVAANAPLAIHWYYRAWRRGAGTHAALNLARLYGKKQDRRGERRWLERAAELGDDEAQMMLVRRAFAKGRGRRKEAVAILKRLAAGKAPERAAAMLLLAEAYRRGIGVHRSRVSARTWSERAATASAERRAGEGRQRRRPVA